MRTVGEDRRTRLSATRLMLIVTPSALPENWPLRVLAALDSGRIGAVQLRLPQAATETLCVQARLLKEVCDPSRTLLLLNDRVDLVAGIGADGAHVGQADLPVAQARALLGRDLLLGLSTHDAAELQGAREAGVDYAGLGPCFASTSKVLAREPGGSGLLAQALPAAGGLPVFAIGGITPQNAALLVAAGATRLAVGAGVLRADDPAAAARFLHTLLERRTGAGPEGVS